jgi:hypothetical protein
MSFAASCCWVASSQFNVWLPPPVTAQAPRPSGATKIILPAKEGILIFGSIGDEEEAEGNIIQPCRRRVGI